MYRIETKFINESQKRFNVITKLISKTDKNTMVLFKEIDYGKQLFKWLKENTNKMVYYIDGKISTEKIMKAQYREKIDSMESMELDEDAHEEYSVLDKAHRVQLNDEMLAAAGIDTNKVKITVEDGKVVITAENS